jgi:hypothetical protein
MWAGSGQAWRAAGRAGRAAPTVLVATLHGCCFESFFFWCLWLLLAITTLAPSLLLNPFPSPFSPSPCLPSFLPLRYICPSKAIGASVVFFLLRLLSRSVWESVVNHCCSCWWSEVGGIFVSECRGGCCWCRFWSVFACLCFCEVFGCGCLSRCAFWWKRGFRVVCRE